MDNNVMVAIRIRQQTPKEVNDLCNVCTRVPTNEPQVWLGTDRVFTFDNIFDTNTKQQHIYDTCVGKLIDGCFEGYNATVMAYGQTGSGKTYTMGTGFNELTSTHTTHTTGIIPRAVEHLFSEINKIQKCARDNGEAIPEFKVNVQYIELYNEEIKDLLIDKHKPKHTEIKIHSDSSGGIYLNGVTTRPMHDMEGTLQCLKFSAQSRTTAETLMNAHSSRSHAIFTIHIKQQRVVTIEPDLLDNGYEMQSNDVIGNREFETLTAKFHFVDLAGSECAKKSGTTGERAHESKSINQSLLALGNVISTLGDKHKKGMRIPSYRDSKLTLLLRDSLGGNSMTLMIACISPCHRDYTETLNTLQYANRAKNIENKVNANHDKLSQTIIALRKENQMLRNELKDYKGSKRLIDGIEKVNETLKHENNKLKEKLNEYKTFHQNLSKTEKTFEEMLKQKMIKTQENDEKDENILNNYNEFKIEKQSIIEHNNQSICENEIQKQKIEECVKVINEKENLVNSCNAEVKQLQQKLFERDVAFNQLLVEKNVQKEEFVKLESVLNNNLHKKSNEISKLNEKLNVYRVANEKCNETTHSLNDTMSGDSDIGYEAETEPTNEAKMKIIKRYKCDYNDCAKSFTAPNELRLHIKYIHSKESLLFKCDYNDFWKTVCNC